jgi:ADP-heptose:LPS heptosyltransferase
MTHRLVYNPHLHTAQLFTLMVEALGLPGERFPACDLVAPRPSHELPRFEPALREVEELRSLVHGGSPGSELPPHIVLNANCSDMLPLRRWAGENYVDLARRLIARYPELRVVFTGGPEEAAPVEKLARAVGSERCLSLAGKTSLRQLLVLLGLSEVLVGNDSGPAHFAALTPVDVVTLFGPETPALYASLSPRSRALSAALACSPCVNAYNNRVSLCTDNVCMRRLTVDRVFEEVCAVYEKRAASRGEGAG